MKCYYNISTIFLPCFSKAYQMFFQLFSSEFGKFGKLKLNFGKNLVAPVCTEDIIRIIICIVLLLKSIDDILLGSAADPN